MKIYFDQTIIDQAILHAKSCYPEESCGFILSDKFLPMENIAEDKIKSFEIDSKEYIKLDGSIQAVVHSHANYPHASKQDMLGQISSNLPWGLICLVNNGVERLAFWGDQLEPQDLVGRTFIHGVYDCYALIRDYYRMKGIILPIHPRENLWWETEPSMLEDGYKDAGFELIDQRDLKEGDVMLMQILSNVTNHSAVYLDKGWMLHHLYNKLSRKEPIGRWYKYITGYYRYKNA